MISHGENNAILRVRLGEYALVQGFQHEMNIFVMQTIFAHMEYEHKIS